MSKEKSLNVIEIIHFYLKAYDYDGLYNPGLCACELSDLMPCGNVEMECTAGYKVDENLKCDCKFHICENKDINSNYECEI